MVKHNVNNNTFTVLWPCMESADNKTLQMVRVGS